MFLWALKAIWPYYTVGRFTPLLFLRVLVPSVLNKWVESKILMISGRTCWKLHVRGTLLVNGLNLGYFIVTKFYRTVVGAWGESLIL